jgi:hypothetical protein
MEWGRTLGVNETRYGGSSLQSLAGRSVLNPVAVAKSMSPPVGLTKHY